MNDATRTLITDIISEFARSQAPKFYRWNVPALRQGYPFHRILFSDQAIVAARVERSVVTSMGQRLFPAMASAIAREHYLIVRTDETIDAPLNDAACNMIEQIVTELRISPRRRTTPRIPDHGLEMTQILGSTGGGTSQRSVTADLYIGDFESGPLFIELKSPLPNLDVTAESKRKILYFLAMQSRQAVGGAEAYLGLTYNPFITRAAYSHSFTRQIMDMDRQVLMGSELWDLIGGPDTYQELLAIVEAVRVPGQ